MFKSYPASIKATGTADGLAEGQFHALVSVFNVVDSMGDMVMPGAFTDTLKEWADSGNQMPIYWSHQMHDPDYNIGWVVDAQETADGLEVIGQLDLEDGGSPKAKQVYRLMKGRRVTQFSFAYDVIEGGPVETDGQAYNALTNLKVYEVGPTPIGANQETDLLAIKDAATLLKRGRVLSAKNETALTEALSAITSGVSSIKSVLAAVASGDDEPKADGNTNQDKAIGTGPVTSKEPSKATGKEPSRVSPPVVLLATHASLLAYEGSAL